MPDLDLKSLETLTSLGSLTLEWCFNIKALSMVGLGALKQLTLRGLPKLEQIPDLSQLTSLQSLTLDDCEALFALRLPAGLLAQLGALKQLELRRLPALPEMPDASGLTSLESLRIVECFPCEYSMPASITLPSTLKELTLDGVSMEEDFPDLSGLTSLEILECGFPKMLSASIFGQLGLLKALKFNLLMLEEMPDVSGLTSLEDLTIEDCRLKTLPTSMGQLGVLKKLTLRGLDMEKMPVIIGELGALKELTLHDLPELKEMPDTLGRLTALEHLNIWVLAKLEEIPDTLGGLTSLEILTLSECSLLKALPASIMHLSRLQHLEVIECPLQDMPCIEALTALRNLHLDVTDYTQENRTFKSLSRSLPCLQQLDKLLLRVNTEPDQNGYSDHMDVRVEDVLAVGRALRAWPLPLLHHVEDYGMDLSLRACRQALGLPAAAADWSNATTLEFFRVQHHKVAAFASGLHARLGAASEVSRLDEQALVMIADEVLGGWGLLREWRQMEGAGAGGGSC